MNWRGLIRWLACLLLGAALAGCGNPKNSATVRYRVIVTAEVDGKRVEGSSVMEITYTRVENSLLGYGGAARLKGEALVLDLNGRGTVYVLPIMHDPSGALGEIYQAGMLTSFGIKSSIGSLEPADLERLRNLKGRVPFKLGRFQPVFAAFYDQAQPTSIYEIDPRDLSARFGPGVRLLGVELEITDAPLTQELVRRLPWLKLKSAIPWVRRRPGDDTPSVSTPLGIKIVYEHFFGNGSW